MQRFRAGLQAIVEEINFSQICHKVLTFAGNRTIMKTTFFEIEKSCLRSVGIRRKGAAARVP